MDPEITPLLLAIQPWIEAYDAAVQNGAATAAIVLPAITTTPAVARLILRALTGQQDA